MRINQSIEGVPVAGIRRVPMNMAVVQARVEQILMVVCALADGDLQARVQHPTSPQSSDAELLGLIDGICARLNELAEEFQAVVARQEQYHRTLGEFARAQARLLRTIRLNSLGRLATGVAHELNQPLQIINLCTDEARCALSEGDLSALMSALDMIEGQVCRGAGVLAGLFSLSRCEGGSQETYAPLNDLVLETAQIWRGQLAAQGIELCVETTPYPVDVACTSSELVLVLTSLVSNARDAVRGRPTQSIYLRTVVEDGTACLEVVDTGAGIAPDDLPRVFDPFFTTKPVGEGVGLGLAISHSIVHRSGGTLEVTTEFGRETRVRALLPIVVTP